jgi:hypothetical protein
MMKRREFLSVTGGAVVACAASTHARGGGSGPAAIHYQFHRGLVAVHDELRSGARGIADMVRSGRAPDPANTKRLVSKFCQRLLDHHRSEDAFLFPGFRKAGRLRSSDIAFLDARDTEHVTIHRLCLAIRDAGTRGDLASTPARGTLAALVAELTAASTPHFAIEEQTLVPEHLAEIITGDQLGRVYRDMGENWNRR